MADVMDFLNVPEGMLDQPIQPWVPKVGDRVRVTAAIAECKVKTQVCESYRRVCSPAHLCFRCPYVVAHEDSERGLLGIVVKIYDDYDHHGIRVRFPWPMTYEVCDYAAYELEPLPSIGADGTEITNEESPAQDRACKSGRRRNGKEDLPE